jgi:hypothetical protein
MPQHPMQYAHVPWRQHTAGTACSHTPHQRAVRQHTHDALALGVHSRIIACINIACSVNTTCPRSLSGVHARLHRPDSQAQTDRQATDRQTSRRSVAAAPRALGHTLATIERCDYYNTLRRRCRLQARTRCEKHSQFVRTTVRLKSQDSSLQSPVSSLQTRVTRLELRDSRLFESSKTF